MSPCFQAACPSRTSKASIRTPLSVSFTRWSVCVVATAGFAWPSYALAVAKTGMSFPHAMTPVFRWSEPVDMKLSGVPIVVRGFAASTTLDQAAQVMARHQKHFQRVTTLPGSILLSGVYAGRHWVAQLEAAPGQVRGLVSALPMNLQPELNDNLGKAFTPWLTQNAGFVFSQSSAVHGRTVTQSVHRIHQPFGQFVSAFGRRMAEAGWQSSGEHWWTAGASAKHGGRGHIKLFSVSAPGQDDVVLINQSH